MPLEMPSEEVARRALREVGFKDAAEAAELSPTAGVGPRRLFTLGMVAEFLRPFDELETDNVRASVNYVNPVGLASWVSDVLGDTALGKALMTIATDGRAYGKQVHDLRTVIIDRLHQYRSIVDPAYEQAS